MPRCATERRGRGAFEECADPRHQLGDLERLAKVVVSAGLEAGDDVARLRPSREHEDRYLGSALPDVAGHVDTVDPGQHQVEDHEVDVIVQEEIDGRGAVTGPEDSVSRMLQLEFDETSDRRVVLDDQNGLPGHGNAPMGL